MSERITITVHDGIKASRALLRASELVEKVTNKDADMYWPDGDAAGFTSGAKQTAIHVWKSDRYYVYREAIKEDEL